MTDAAPPTFRSFVDWLYATPPGWATADYVIRNPRAEAVLALHALIERGEFREPRDVRDLLQLLGPTDKARAEQACRLWAVFRGIRRDIARGRA